MDILNHEFLLFLKCAQDNNLRYMLIGGYAVNFYGYVRNTKDMDVWLAPSNENKIAFVNTLRCMKYSESEVAPLLQEDFTKPFMGSIGSSDNIIDILTVVHHKISFEEAEQNKNVFEIADKIYISFVPYASLKEMKLLSHSDKDLWDIARLEELMGNSSSDL